MRKYSIAFICVHNSCRSQMAEAIAKLLHHDFFEAQSGGTHTKDVINPEAVETIKDLYDYDMSETQAPTLIDTIDSVDIVVTMGCNVACPYLPTKHREDWGLDDPSGGPKEGYLETARIIKEKMQDLRQRIENGHIKL